MSSASTNTATGAETAGGIDWGFSGMTVWDVGMAHKDNIVVELENRIWSQVRSGVIIEDIVEDVLAYRMKVIHADASHPFENADLRAAINKAIRSCLSRSSSAAQSSRCRSAGPIQIAEQKKTATASRQEGHQQEARHREGGDARQLPRATSSAASSASQVRNKAAIWQHKRYRYQKNSDKPREGGRPLPRRHDARAASLAARQGSATSLTTIQASREARNPQSQAASSNEVF